MAERGAIGGTVRDRLVKPGGCRIDLGRPADHPQGRHALTMFYVKDEGGEAGLNSHDQDGRRGEAISHSPLDAVPKNV